MRTAATLKTRASWFIRSPSGLPIGDTLSVRLDETNPARGITLKNVDQQSTSNGDVLVIAEMGLEQHVIYI
jgi:hypothetical protein